MLECAIMAVLFCRLQSGSQRGNGHGSPLSMHDGDGERRKLHPAARAPEASIIIQTVTVTRTGRVVMAGGSPAAIGDPRGPTTARRGGAAAAGPRVRVDCT